MPEKPSNPIAIGSNAPVHTAPSTLRLDTFMLGILAAEVQRKGIGLSISNIVDVKNLAEKAIRAVDGELI